MKENNYYEINSIVALKGDMDNFKKHAINASFTEVKSKEDVETIVDLLKSSKNLTSLTIQNSEFLNDTYASEIASALLVNKSVHRFQLDGKNITKNGAMLLDKAVEDNKNILNATYPNQSRGITKRLANRNERVEELKSKWIAARQNSDVLSKHDIRDISKRATVIKYLINSQDINDKEDILRDFDKDLESLKKQPAKSVTKQSYKEEAPKHAKPGRDEYEAETEEELKEEIDTEQEYNYARLVGGSLLGVAGIALLGFAAYSLLGPERGALVFGAGMMKTAEEKMEQIESMTWKELGVTCLCGLAAVGLLGAAVFVIAPEQVRPIFEKILDAVIERTIGTAGMELG